MSIKNKGSFLKILASEVQKSHISYQVFLIVFIIINATGFYELTGEDVKGLTRSTDNLYNLTDTIYVFIENINIYVILLGIVIMLLFIIKCITSLEGEWFGQNKSIYNLLSLPIPRYKIYFSKFIVCISSFIVNIAISIISVVVLSFKLIELAPSELKEYLKRNILISISNFNLEFLIQYLLVGLLLISIVFFIIITSKSIGGFAGIMVMISIGAFGIGPFLESIYLVVSRDMGIYLDISSQKSFMMIGIIIIFNALSINMFKNKISV